MPTLDYLAPAFTSLHPQWKNFLQQPALFSQLCAIDQQLSALNQQGQTIYPQANQIFAALCQAPEAIRAVILGQDPYHGEGEAMGLSFSVPREIKIPPSLRNIYKELASDLQQSIPTHGDLCTWAEQGVLLLNTSLTVAASQAGSHGKIGWQGITDAIIAHVSQQSPACVFLLWGKWAQSKAQHIDIHKHLILESVHPSPLSVHRGFWGCRHFSRTNAWLKARGIPEICW